MYINCGGNVILPKKKIIGIFDLDSATVKETTKVFLNAAEREGRLTVCGNDLPKAFVLTKERVYLTTLSAASLVGRNK